MKPRPQSFSYQTKNRPLFPVKETYPAKGIIIFKVEKIYNCIPGPNAGNLIEEK